MNSKERLEFYKKEWLKNNVPLMAFCAVLWIAGVIICRALLHLNAAVTGGGAGVLGVVLYGYISNKRMSYAEGKAYDGSRD